VNVIWSTAYGVLARALEGGLTSRSDCVAVRLHSEGGDLHWYEAERHPITATMATGILVGPESLLLGSTLDSLPAHVCIAVVDIGIMSRSEVASGFLQLISAVSSIAAENKLRAMIGLDQVAIVGEPSAVRQAAKVLVELGARMDDPMHATRGELRRLPTAIATSQRGVRALRNREFVRETVPRLLGEVSAAVERLKDLGLVEAVDDFSSDASWVEHSATSLPRDAIPALLEARTAVLDQQAHMMLAHRVRSLRAAGLLTRADAPELALAAADGYATAAAKHFGFERARVVAGDRLGSIDALTSEREVLIELPGHLAVRAGSYPLLALPIVTAMLDPDGVVSQRAPVDLLTRAADVAGRTFGMQVAYALERFGHPSLPMAEQRIWRAARDGATAPHRRAGVADVRDNLERGVSIGADPVLVVEALLTGAFGSRDSYVNEAAVFADLVRAR
jgi:hypothetical protein